jgi:hypothetical protein
MKRMAFSALGLSLAAWLAGCGEGTGSVNGTVTFDGQPVANGSITFVRTEGSLVREGAVIRDGSFQVQVPPGKYRIELTAQRVKGKKKQIGFSGEEEEVEITEEMFPERYNTKSELSEEIRSGTHSLNLDLKSKK